MQLMPVPDAAGAGGWMHFDAPYAETMYYWNYQLFTLPSILLYQGLGCHSASTY